MKSWKITEQRKLELVQTASEEAKAGYVKIKINETVLSLPDLRIYNGAFDVPLPITPGRCCAGLVTEVGEGVTTLERGDRVYVDSLSVCGICRPCKESKYFACENQKIYGADIDGFMRDFAVVPAKDCTKLPDRIKDSEAIFLDYISIAVQVINSLNVQKGEHIVISGASVLGLVLGQVALYYQAIPIVVDIKQNLLDKAEELGIYYTANSVNCDPKSKVFHITGGRMAENVVHIASSAIPVSQSFNFVARGGRLAITERKGCLGDLSGTLDAVAKNAVTVIGVAAGKNTSVAINMLANKAVHIDSLITREINFTEIPDAFESSSKNADEHIKTIIKMH